MSPVCIKRSNDNALYQIDLTDFLAADETVTSVTALTVDQATTPPLQLGTATVNTAPVVFPTRTAAAGKVIQFNIAGGTPIIGGAARNYTIRPVLLTNRNTALEATVGLRVDDAP